MEKQKSKVAAALLAFFLGAYGGHNFYLGNPKLGAIKLVVTIICMILYMAVNPFFYIVILAMGIWALVDFIRILMNKVPDANGNPLA